MARGRTLALALVLLLTMSPAAVADTTTVTYLQMFFFSGDMIGLIIVWLLLLMSAFSLGFAIMLFMQYGRSRLIPQETRAELESMLADKKYREAINFAQTDNSYLGRLASSALGEANNGYGAMERAIEEAGDMETTRILRPVEYLNVVGNIAPMIGLFGTVYGMIVAFQQLVEAGGGAEPAELAAGISTALVTTFWGLVVAIPALAAYATIRNRIDALTSEGMVVAEQIITPFKPAAKRGAAPSVPVSSAAAGVSSAGGSRQRATPKPEVGDSKDASDI
ncbi:MotA/TolQ/ExbB proton channel family protein [Phycisphaerales bacterium AB-hyl4]|uniref:MotA/TolQ/ExbB proton channel family protein n=1 Tax=Natronomicrosphaera hydrolytica TaxID=3242702 RepID=A0ABV4U3A9_9BACT